MHLYIDDVTVKYGSTVAVQDANLVLSSGVHALLGPNGAGKSSLLEVIATLRKPSSGSFRFTDNDSDSVNRNDYIGMNLRHILGYLPQENLPKSHFTVREHLAYMCWLKQIPDENVPAEDDRLIKLAELSDKADATIASLSGGMRRRVRIASALVGSPRLLILDQASAGLDMAQRDSLRRIVATVAHNAVVLTSIHIVEDIIDIANTLTVMSRGAFMFSGGWDEFCHTRQLPELKAQYLELVGER